MNQSTEALHESRSGYSLKMKCCVYYDNATGRIIDIIPDSIEAGLRSEIERYWAQEIPRQLLINISKYEETNAAQIKSEIGHSSSTLHENIRKLEKAGLIEAKMAYKGNKVKVIRPKMIAVSKNPEHKRKFKVYFKGIWVESEKSRRITEFLRKNKDRFYTAEEISTHTKVPVDDVELLLSNWDSYTTRALSDFFKERPFIKKVMYKGK